MMRNAWGRHGTAARRWLSGVARLALLRAVAGALQPVGAAALPLGNFTIIRYSRREFSAGAV